MSESVSESYQANNNTMIAAYQELYAVNSNSELDEVVDLDGEDDSDTAVGYNSGNNSVNDNAFAAFRRHRQPGLEHWHQCQHPGSNQHRCTRHGQLRS